MSKEMERVAEAIRAFERGEIVVVTDDDDRENEGDLIVAASRVTTEQMAFIVRHCCGIVCAPMTLEDARRLQLAPMVADNDAPLGTAFTVTVDYKHDTTTGISASDRTATVRALANHNAGAVDFVRPGHIFPLVAKDGGVLVRSGHTEAAVDLCRLAGLPPVGVICELVNDDGTVKRGSQVEEFALEHNLRQVSVADMIAYRQRKERLVERTGEVAIETAYGKAHAISYSTPFDPMQHLAIVFGDIRDGQSIPVRLHMESVVADVFGTDQELNRIMDRFSADRGVIVYLREGSPGVTGDSKTLHGSRQDALKNAESEKHNSAQSRDTEWRDIGLGAQILADLGIESIRLLASRKRHYVGLDGFGIEIKATDII
ncbi:MAG: 3,4-dihydroxy-2-butanone-4-phosphate synthase [Hyphomicrobiales bacterium]|nr:MAG: 3,4-dihydroxy-2-butanone-4-phosphate synthase [Hyphomicrobiales bacterium]